MVARTNTPAGQSRTWSFAILGMFIAGYLLWGASVFLRSSNTEFLIYVAVIVAIFGVVLAFDSRVKFPIWMLWGIAIWGLMHVMGGGMRIDDHVLFAHRIYPLIDRGGEFYVLKYDQVVHGYLYGLVALMSDHLVRQWFSINGHRFMLAMLAVLVSLGISGLNEIMEFFISLTMESGVGGYDNTLLDMCFNFGGAVVAMAAEACLNGTRPSLHEHPRG